MAVDVIVLAVGGVDDRSCWTVSNLPAYLHTPLTQTQILRVTDLRRRQCPQLLDSEQSSHLPVCATHLFTDCTATSLPTTFYRSPVCRLTYPSSIIGEYLRRERNRKWVKKSFFQPSLYILSTNVPPDLARLYGPL